jgi:hypothetical protein
MYNREEMPPEFREMVTNDRLWLEEELAQLSYPELDTVLINSLSLYFDLKTKNFYSDLVKEKKLIDTSLFKQEMSIARSKIVNAAIKVHGQVLRKKLDPEINTTMIVAALISLYGKTIYEGAADLFPSAQ